MLREIEKLIVFEQMRTSGKRAKKTRFALPPEDHIRWRAFSIADQSPKVMKFIMKKLTPFDLLELTYLSRVAYLREIESLPDHKKA